MLYTRWFGSFTAYHTSPIYVHSPQSWFGVLHLLLLRKSDIGKTIVILWVVRVMVCAAARRALRLTLKASILSFKETFQRILSGIIPSPAPGKDLWHLCGPAQRGAPYCGVANSGDVA